DASFHSWG
uniref:Leucokinin-4 n=1 Tax=Rhyparobia maderae TaxID=36963 RepID=LCK4_RHYMA|nr:RecName: Full=Leucokinin-4; AltName: Full=Leucokinin IV; Short=L-IV [Rhyparobia maderae]